jgi:hypothetical protein
MMRVFLAQFLLAKINHPLGDFLNPALALLGQGLKKSPIGQKLDFANHPYLCKGPHIDLDSAGSGQSYVSITLFNTTLSFEDLSNANALIVL